jgi:hypothetical protein
LVVVADEGADLPITGAELTTVAKAVGAARRALRRPDPVRVLKRRTAVRDEIKRNLRWPERDEAPEVLVIRHTKYDDYGKPDNRIIARGASDWFKAEIKGLDERGLEVYSAIEYVVIRKGKAYRVYDETRRGARKVWVVGRIPYERIAYMDWSRDTRYAKPRFYVAYSWRREAYREVVLYEGDPSTYLYEMADVVYKGEGGGPIKRLKRMGSHVRYRIRDARDQKRWRSERYKD